MIQLLKKVLHMGAKAYKGNLFDGVSYETQKINEQKGRDLEQAISDVASATGFKVLTNVYLPHIDTYTELDVVVVGNGVVLVIEAKNYSATITGETTDTVWLATYNNDTEYTLYNPYKQVLSQIKKLTNHLGVPVKHLVVFSDKANLHVRGTGKTMVLNLKDLEWALKNQKGTLTEREEKEIIQDLKKFQTKNPITKLKQQKNAIKNNKRA